MRVHVIRHGEVENPNHVVYADLAGFHLSEHGMAQAAAVSDHLRQLLISRVVSSPLDRAVATATAITESRNLDVVTDERLTEWRLGSRWAGVRWEDLPVFFPGELEAYLATPLNLPFSPESLADLAERVSDAVNEWSAGSPGGDVVFVSHQDPIHAALRVLTNSGFDSYHQDKPEHCSVSSLEHTGTRWIMTQYWAPEQ